MILLKYPKNHPKYGHFGYYTEEMIRQTAKLENQEEKEYLTLTLGNLMKKNYLNYHTENVENGVILNHLKELSKGELKIDNPEDLMNTSHILRQFGISNAPKQKGRMKSKKRKK